MGLKELVGTRIRAARRKLNWNQQRLADAVGIAQPSIAAYETGRVNVPLDTIDRIADVLGKPIAYFTVADFESVEKAPLPEVESKKGQSKRGAPKEPAR